MASSHPRQGVCFPPWGNAWEQPVFFFYYIVVVLGLIAGCGLSLVAESRGYLVIAMLELLIPVVSLVAEHRL